MYRENHPTSRRPVRHNRGEADRRVGGAQQFAGGTVNADTTLSDSDEFVAGALRTDIPGCD